MKFGVCCSIKNQARILKLQELGFDYFDVSFKMMVRLTEEEFANALDFVKGIQFPCIATNCLLESSYNIASGDYDIEELNTFLETGFKRVAELGVRYVVFGSGGARSISKDMNYDEGYQRIVEFTRKIAKIADGYGITIAIEPLQKLECNIVNTVSEGVKLAKDSGCNNVKGHADYFHMSRGDSIENLLELNNQIAYSHISNTAITRGFPKKSKKYDYKPFIDALKKIGCEYCSIEGLAIFFESACRKSIALLRELDK